MEPIDRLATIPSVKTESADEAEWSNVLLGDGEAFGRIFDRHRARVFRHSYRLVSITADADDLVSITFLEAWRRRHDIRFIDGSMLPWLLVTATNASHNLSRSTHRYRQLLAQLPPDTHGHNSSLDLEAGDAHEALRSLSAADQRVITLCVLEGFSERDAAEALGIPAGTVKSRLFRAKTRMARHVIVSRSSQHPMEATDEI
jgi:RNA polymerase sigma factor (sigma-70 family)